MGIKQANIPGLEIKEDAGLDEALVRCAKRIAEVEGNLYDFLTEEVGTLADHSSYVHYDLVGDMDMPDHVSAVADAVAAGVKLAVKAGPKGAIFSVSIAPGDVEGLEEAGEDGYFEFWFAQAEGAEEVVTLLDQLTDAAVTAIRQESGLLPFPEKTA